VAEAKDSLAKDGVETAHTKYSPIGLALKGKAYLAKTKAFNKGHVEIQDEGSQLIAALCDAKPGMRVLDYCAGGGGKTLALASAMENKGSIVASDNDARRLERGRKRYRKAGVHNVELKCIEDEKVKKWFKRQKETFDVVLVDAPCSSSGTWRRNPDLRWRFYGPSLDEIKSLQTQIMDRVAKCVKPGGRLVYATCSVFKEENENQIEQFLKDNPDFALMPMKEAWPYDAKRLPQNCDDYMFLSPHSHGTDGFFCAALVKKLEK
jgi:16S rRNA (cytosine967-C5)-methyltransferase